MTLRKRTCEIVQALEHGQYLTKEFILDVISKHSCIEKYAFVLHDKDRLDDGTLKKPHWHIFLQFDNAQKFSDVCKWFAVEEQYVNSLRTRFNEAVVYCTHTNAPDKYQYDYSEVISNFNYEQFCLRYLEDKKNKELKENPLDFINHNMMYYKKLYWDSPRKLKDIKYCYDNWLDIQAKEKMNMNKQVMYICGNSGCGKTSYAKCLAMESYNTDEIFISSSSNDILYGYNGEKCIILDDLRSDSMNFADLMKFLDNNTSSSVKSRYNNKQMARCELIIITSIKEPRELYPNLDETKIQLYRRLSVFMKIAKVDTGIKLNYYKWVDTEQQFKRTFVLNITKVLNDFFAKFGASKYDNQLFEKIINTGAEVEMDLGNDDDDEKYPF